ncbi:hypothetical protein ACVSQB_33040 [Bradyrhizobium elkanii]
MKHPSKITHLGIDYDLNHLAQRTVSFDWTHLNKQMKLAVRVRYSNHCYSLEHYGQKEPEGSCFVTDNSNRSRLFCPTRHGHSLCLPDLFRQISEKPTHPVALTAEDNWSIFRLQLVPPMQAGEKYWVFFRVKLNSVLSDGSRLIDLYVESAYPRTTDVVTFRRLPFGRLIAEIALRG